MDGPGYSPGPRGLNQRVNTYILTIFHIFIRLIPLIPLSEF